MRVNVRWWRPLALTAVALALVALVVCVDHPDDTRFWDALFDAGHAPLFGVLALAIRGLVPVRVRRRDAVAFAGVVTLAVLTEALQALQPERAVSAVDIARDVAAGGAFLLLRARASTRGAGPGRSPARVPGRSRVVLAVLLLATCFAELGFVVATYAERYRQLPTVATFDGAWWTRGMIETGPNVLEWPAPLSVADTAAAPFARLTLQPAQYSGIAIVEPYPDWRGYERLVVPIASDLGAPLRLTLRIHDAAHDQRYADRYNLQVLVHPGVNRVSIPLADVRRSPDRREMDMSSIRGVVLFAHQLTEPSRLFLGPITLE